ncbi:hypothetical protein [Methylophaga thiooxydans]|uniref:hypothetical protein n=1 Tax=Methylophaga thiooxydans TaxID=392484 RepID=UPI0023544991|nr:hypothetical protein [Methylophaga thiooxydans]
MLRKSHIDGIESNNPALQIFYQSAALRYGYPLEKGRYKLEEGIECMRRILSTYRAGLSDRQLAVVSGKYESCMDFEFDEWLLSIPEFISYFLGYKVLPGLSALTGDGVPQEQATKAVQNYLERVPLKLNELDSIWLKLTRSKQYKKGDLLAMERVYGELLEFCEATLAQFHDEL